MSDSSVVLEAGRACRQAGCLGRLRQRRPICKQVASSDSPQKLKQENRMRKKHKMWTIKLRKLPRKETKMTKT